LRQRQANDSSELSDSLGIDTLEFLVSGPERETWKQRKDSSHDEYVLSQTPTPLEDSPADIRVWEEKERCESTIGSFSCAFMCDDQTHHHFGKHAQEVNSGDDRNGEDNDDRSENDLHRFINSESNNIVLGMRQEAYPRREPHRRLEQSHGERRICGGRATSNESFGFGCAANGRLRASRADFKNPCSYVLTVLFDSNGTMYRTPPYVLVHGTIRPYDVRMSRRSGIGTIRDSRGPGTSTVAELADSECHTKVFKYLYTCTVPIQHTSTSTVYTSRVACRESRGMASKVL
jgi:hypothetical protein